MIFYYGGFPPPYGGVTIKNKLLFEQLSPLVPMRKMDTLKAKRNPLLLLRQTARLVLCPGARFVVATSFASRKRITMLLWRFNRRAMKNSVVMVMGGLMAQDAAADPAYARALKQYRRLFVETPSMAAALQALGFENVSVYPNCRTDNRVDAIRPTGETLRCLFFSRISPEKGADVVLEAAAATPHIQYDFYGETDEDYRASFLQTAGQLPNVTFHGVFASDGVNLYEKLHQYDVLLLPTRYKDEGVPGVLVEAKIAGLPAVVSNASYNAEIVSHGVSGILLPECSGSCLARELSALAQSRQTVDELKTGALSSAEDYLIETYLPQITEYLR